MCKLFWSRQSGFICWALKKFRRKKNDTVVRQGELIARFEVRERFLSDCELQCHRLLSQAVGERGIVCPKPRALETLRVLDAPQHLDEAIRIERKHVDFIVCDLATGHPQCAVLIDWWDQETETFRPREQLLAQAFELAGLPVVYVRSDQLPTVGQLKNQIATAVAGRNDQALNRIDSAHASMNQPEHSPEPDYRSV